MLGLQHRADRVPDRADVVDVGHRQRDFTDFDSLGRAGVRAPLARRDQLLSGEALTTDKLAIVLNLRTARGVELAKKLVAVSEIVTAIRTVNQGRRYITTAVAELLAQQLNRPDGGQPHEQLSEREFQVFLRLAKGETVGDIAEALSLSVKTVSTYRTRIMEKMTLTSNSDLTYYALKGKLID